jgi:glutathione synthase/RimK-type ligase-like ATP-grasp enzyme
VRVALPTCARLPDWEVDDAPLHRALEARGASIERPVWDDAGVDWACFDACLIRTTWDYQEKRDAFLAWAQRVDALTRLYNPLGVVRWNTHKHYLRDLGARGLPVVPTVWLDRGSRVDVGAIVAERAWPRAFIKPAIGATARETLRFAGDAAGVAAARAHVARLVPDEDLLLQPYLPNVETAGEVSVLFIDGVFSHAVRKVPVPGDYRVQDDFGAHDEPFAATEELIALTRRFLDAVDADLLYARADYLFDDAGEPRLSELELVEPSLFFRHCPATAERLADGLLRRLAQ